METYKELLAAYVAAVKGVEFWRSNGTWGDGKLEIAKRERAAAKRALNAYVRLLLNCINVAMDNEFIDDMRGGN